MAIVSVPTIAARGTDQQQTNKDSLLKRLRSSAGRSMPEDVNLYRCADNTISDNELYEENPRRVSRPSRDVAEFAALRQRVQDIEVSEAEPESSRAKVSLPFRVSTFLLVFNPVSETCIC